MPKARVSHPIFARIYGWASPKTDANGLAVYRRRLLAGLCGTVIEVGAGNGLNFAHYPPEVSRVLAVEPEPHLRTLAERAAAQAPVSVEVIDGDAERLPIGDATFDAAVASLMLCSVRDPAKALREMRRVVRPGGQLRVFEHVRADTPALGRVQRLLDATIWPAACGGCHLHRDTTAAIERAGFTIERLDRIHYPESGVSWPASPCILGVATRP
ncbi:MAG: class I SAM-dependent methyltransferase [Dehalococcoidia bacterium]